MNIQLSKKNLIALAIFFVMMIIVFILALFQGSGKEENTITNSQLTQNTPLSTEDRSVTFQGDITFDNTQDLKMVYSYEIDDDDIYTKALDFVAKSNKPYEGDTSGYEITVWGDRAGEHMKLDELTGKLSFYFTTGPSLTLLTGNSSGDVNAQFIELLKTLNGNDEEYQVANYKITSEGIRYEAYRYINGFPIETGAHAQYTDFIEVDSAGRLIRGSINLLEFKQVKEVELVDSNDINNIFSSSAGYYEYQEIIPASYYGIEDSTTTVVPENSGLPVEVDDDFYPTDFSGALTDGCVAQSASVVYFYRSLSQEYLTPNFKVKCNGSTYKDGKAFEIPVIIYVDAMKPGN
jgi:hypothetical protein